MSISEIATFAGTTFMTQRNSATLSRYFGFDSPEALANSLPENAQVLDAGAGASTFGHTISAMRPDVIWTNYDKGYDNQDIVAELSKQAPENLAFVAGDIADITDHIASDSQDRVYSYWALQYADKVRPLVRNLVTITNPNGRLSVGPMSISGEEFCQTIAISPSENDPELNGAIIDHISRALVWGEVNGSIQRLSGASYAAITVPCKDQDSKPTQST